MTSTTVRKATAPQYPPLGPTDRAIKAALLEAVDLIKDQTTLMSVVEALESGNVQTAIDIIRWDLGEDFLRRNLPAALRDAVELGAEHAEQGLEKAGISLAFDLTNPRAVEYVRRRGGDLIREWGDSSKLGLRVLLDNAISEGVAPRVLARQVMSSGIGLTERYALAVERFRGNLEDDENVDRHQEQVDRMTERYSNRLLRNRSETIARTETMAASNAGQRELWRQARDQGLIGFNAAQEWMASDLENMCDECEALDGETTPIGGAFPGGLPGPPAHPRCTCTTRLLPDGAD